MQDWIATHVVDGTRAHQRTFRHTAAGACRPRQDLHMGIYVNTLRAVNGLSIGHTWRGTREAGAGTLRCCVHCKLPNGWCCLVGVRELAARTVSMTPCVLLTHIRTWNISISRTNPRELPARSSVTKATTSVARSSSLRTRGASRRYTQAPRRHRPHQREQFPRQTAPRRCAARSAALCSTRRDCASGWAGWAVLAPSARRGRGGARFARG